MTIWLHGKDGVRFAADSFGDDDAPPVLLFGGLGQTRHSWRRAAQKIAANGWRALPVDLLGHGDSDPAGDGDYSYPRHVTHLIAITAHLGTAPVLVGASLGGKICLAAAGYHPEIASALVLVDTAPRTRQAGIQSMSQAFAPPPQGFASPDEAAKIIAEMRGKKPAADAGEKLQRNMKQDAQGRWHWHWDRAYADKDQRLGTEAGLDYLESAARGVTAPMLIAKGELSNIVTDESVAALTALAPHAQTAIIKGAGHMLVGDDNDVFTDILLEFLANLPGKENDR